MLAYSSSFTNSTLSSICMASTIVTWMILHRSVQSSWRVMIVIFMILAATWDACVESWWSIDASELGCDPNHADIDPNSLISSFTNCASLPHEGSWLSKMLTMIWINSGPLLNFQVYRQFHCLRCHVYFWFDYGCIRACEMHHVHNVSCNIVKGLLSKISVASF